MTYITYKVELRTVSQSNTFSGCLCMNIKWRIQLLLSVERLFLNDFLKRVSQKEFPGEFLIRNSQEEIPPKEI